MKFILIMTIVMWGKISNSGSGGVSIETQPFETLAECQAVKSVFINKMTMTDEEISGRRHGNVIITRKAECIELP